MRGSNLLVFTACYNERENIGPLLDQVVAQLPAADLLVIDDNSPDGTWEVLTEKGRIYAQLTTVKRPRKLGIGSAHKYALLYALRAGYDTLVTMDADFSHDPKYLPALLSAHGENTFVTGSRYCTGGTSDYRGYRDFVSRLGNFAARNVLGVKLRELTTYYRVFDVNSLRRVPLRYVSANGYSFGVQVIDLLRQAGVALREVPIHFADRTRGASKIPRLQILLSALDLIRLAAKRLSPSPDRTPDFFVQDACSNCGDRVLAMKYAGSSTREPSAGAATSDRYRSTSAASAGAPSYPPVYKCLHCGLEQVPASLIPHRIEHLYEEVIDTEYLQNNRARAKTFARSFDQIESSLPRPPAAMLEVGAHCGLFGREAVRRGWTFEAVEPSRWAAQYARNEFGLNVHTGFLSDNRANLKPTYDAVVAWDVLEHVREPLMFVKECASFLDRDGVFCFSTLDVDNWYRRLTGRRWVWLMDMHLQYFDRHSVNDLLSRAGLELVRVEPYTHYARLDYALRGAANSFPPSSGVH